MQEPTWQVSPITRPSPSPSPFPSLAKALHPSLPNPCPFHVSSYHFKQSPFPCCVYNMLWCGQYTHYTDIQCNHVESSLHACVCCEQVTIMAITNLHTLPWSEILQIQRSKCLLTTSKRCLNEFDWKVNNFHNYTHSKCRKFGYFCGSVIYARKP